MKYIYTFTSLCFTFLLLDFHVPEVVLLTAHLSYTHNSMLVSLSPQKLHSKILFQNIVQGVASASYLQRRVSFQCTGLSGCVTFHYKEFLLTCFV